MFSTTVVLLQLLWLSLASASHFLGGVVTFDAKRTSDGNVQVQLRNKATFRECEYQYGTCYGSYINCGYNNQIDMGVIDRSSNGPTYSNTWCQTETVVTKVLTSDKLFQTLESSCCWITEYPFGNTPSWSVLTSVDLGTRSDTNGPNNSPDIAILPFLRIPQNCRRSYKPMSFDPDGDVVRCRYGNGYNSECGDCKRQVGFQVDQATCTLHYLASGDQGVHEFELVVEDFPQNHVMLSYSDGSWSYRYRSARKKRAPTTTTVYPTTTTTVYPTTTTTVYPTTTITGYPTTTITGYPTTTITGYPTTTTTGYPTTTITGYPTTTTGYPTTTITGYPTTTITGYPTTTTTGYPTTTTTVYPTTTTTGYPTTTITGYPTTTITGYPTTTTTGYPTTTTTGYPTTTTTGYPTTTTGYPTTTTTVYPTTTTTGYPTTTITGYPTTTITGYPTTTITGYPTTTMTAAPTTTAATNTWWPWWYTTNTPLTTTYFGAWNSPFSKLPLQFVFEVDPPVPTCAEGYYLPRFVSPTPRDGEVIQAAAGRELDLRVKAEALYSQVDDIIMSGPLNITKHRTSGDVFSIRWTPIHEDIGHYFPICFAVEYKSGYSVYQTEMRCVLVNVTDQIVNTVVTCQESSMIVEVEKATLPQLHYEHLRLSDPSNTVCSLQTYSNNTHIVAIVPLNACGTQIEERGDDLLFKNEITAVDNASSIITRKHLVEIKFFCQYSKRGNVTFTFSAHRGDVTVWSKGFGWFTYGFEFYPDEGFVSRIDPQLYPLEYELGDRIYMKIEATTTVNNTELFVESCTAAPYDTPNYPNPYTLIENGCNIDPTLIVYSSSHSSQFKFSIEAFKFIGLYDQVYISCSVLMCKAGDPFTRCAQGCQPSGQTRAKREAVIQSGTHYVSQGPLRLKRSMQTGNTGLNLNLNLVFISGCALAAVGMICAVLFYKAKKSRVNYQPLPSDES